MVCAPNIENCVECRITIWKMYGREFNNTNRKQLDKTEHSNQFDCFIGTVRSIPLCQPNGENDIAKQVRNTNSKQFVISPERMGWGQKMCYRENIISLNGSLVASFISREVKNRQNTTKKWERMQQKKKQTSKTQNKNWLMVVFVQMRDLISMHWMYFGIGYPVDCVNLRVCLYRVVGVYIEFPKILLNVTFIQYSLCKCVLVFTRYALQLRLNKNTETRAFNTKRFFV